MPLPAAMSTRTVKYVEWLTRRSRWVLAVGAAVAAISAYLTIWHLPLRADLAYLLPRDAPSVRDGEKLLARMPAKDTNLVLVVAPDPTIRAAAAAQALAGIRRISPELVERAEADDAETRAFVTANAALYVPLADLQLARDTLSDVVATAKAKANPLFVDLDDDDDEGPRGPIDPRFDELKRRRTEAEATYARSRFVSADGTTQVIILRTAFVATDIHKDRALQTQLDEIAAGVKLTYPSAEVGFAGGVTVTLAEQAALVRGVLLSSLITAVLVAVVLFAYLRSVKLILLLTANLVVGVLVAFGVAALTVGHLNAATAFLGAIIAGNGVNYGILLVARYLEERRGVDGAPATSPCGAERSPAVTAMSAALAGTLKPTLVASLGAAIAYGALAATKFRGFADFAWIGGVGMLVCWIASFTLLPVLVMRFAPAPRRTASPWFGTVITRVFGLRRPVLACAGAGAITIAAGVLTWQYIQNDPFEYDMTEMRSRGEDARQARAWMRRSDEAFGRGLAGIAGQTYVAVDDPAQVPGVVAALKQAAAKHSIVGPVTSILDALPPDQREKLALATEIRTLIDLVLGEAGHDLPADLRAQLAAFRPRDDLHLLTAADLPRDWAVKLTERDGSVGRIVAVKPSAEFDELNGKDLIAFATAVRNAKVGDAPVMAAGPSVLFADVLQQIQQDGPMVTLVAGLGLTLMVLLVVGRSRRSIAVLAATGSGTLAMIAVCAVAGLEINFLDFVALPITLGLGIDYAINVADRAEHDASDPLGALRTTGGAVFVCSLTTIIGYASLFASDNNAIRGFGLASLVGEITCAIAAFVVVPAIMALPRMKDLPSSDSSMALPQMS